MTKEELDEILRVLGIDADRAANQIYVFYVLPDGRVDNFSLTVKKGRRMSDEAVERLMRREYPSTREGHVLAVERPEWRPPEQQWLDAVEAANMLKVTTRTLRTWREKGYLTAYQPGNGRVYYSRQEIDRLIESNALQENGRMDKTALADEHEPA